MGCQIDRGGRALSIAFRCFLQWPQASPFAMITVKTTQKPRGEPRMPIISSPATSNPGAPDGRLRPTWSLFAAGISCLS